MNKNENTDLDKVLASLNGLTTALTKVIPTTVDGGVAAADPFYSTGEDDLIHPEGLEVRVLEQETMEVHPVLDTLCLTPEPGIPRGSTIMLSGGPGKGKTRTAMECALRASATGVSTVFVVSEEGYFDVVTGRDDLHSRMIKMSRRLGLDWSGLTKNLTIIQCQYYKGKTWNDFVRQYQELVGIGVKFAVIDSLTGLDPAKNASADNLNALKTYNHAHGITCLVTSQIKETGMPAGGNAVLHTADVVFHLSELSMSSKEMAKDYGLNYRDKIDTVECLKSNTTPVIAEPIRIHMTEGYIRCYPDVLPPPNQIEPLQNAKPVYKDTVGDGNTRRRASPPIGDTGAEMNMDIAELKLDPWDTNDSKPRAKQYGDDPDELLDF